MARRRMAHRARKRFGQNFLIDHSVIDQILSSIAVQDDDHVVEIGPGRGALTATLAKKARQLSIVEIDRDLVALLKKQFRDQAVEILSADALKVDFAQFGGNIRVVGNLPYNISTPLLFHLARFRFQIIDMHFMLQREVVQRMVAEPGSKTYGRLSVMLQSQFGAVSLFDVSPDAFDPAPKVWSAIVRLTPLHKQPDIQDAGQFERVVTQAFSQRRKTLRNSLRNLLTAEQIEQAGCDPGGRPETVSVAQFACLSNLIIEQ